MTTPKTTGMQRFIAAYEEALALDPNRANGAIGDALTAMRRVIKRAQCPVDMERVELVQTRGPVVEFTGHRLSRTEFPVRQGTDKAVLEIWQTETGAMVAVRDEPAGLSALVVPPGPDEAAQKMAVMEFFAWQNGARSMARKLGWSLRQDVD